jgi:hypothetical protein
MNTNRYNDAWAKIVSAVWIEKDGGIRRRLEEEPKAVFAEFGAEFPEDIEVDVVRNSTDKLTFVIPVAPVDLADITDEDIAELYQACPGTQLDMGG